MPVTSDGEQDGDPFQLHPDADAASVSMEGTLAYSESPKVLQQLAWADRSGNILGKFGQPQKSIGFWKLSPDERFVAGVDRLDMVENYLKNGAKSRYAPTEVRQSLLVEIGGLNKTIFPTKESRMKNNIEVFVDFASPWACLGFMKLYELYPYGTLQITPVLVGAIFRSYVSIQIIFYCLL